MLKTVLIAVISSAVVSIGAMAVNEHFFAKKQQVVTVDLQKVIADEIQNNMKAGVSDAAREERGRRFGTALENVLNTAAAEGENLVMVAPAVIRGAVDITDQVKASIEADMKKSTK